MEDNGKRANNQSLHPDMFLLQTYLEKNNHRLWTFIAFFLIYLFILVENLTLIMLIIMERQLHKPVYIFLSATVPRALYSLVVTNVISFPICVVQVFFLHFYTIFQTDLFALMAIDRYVAIHYPLRYNVLITNSRVHKVNVLVISSAILMVLGFVFLLLPLTFCEQKLLPNSFCSHVGLFTLACDDTTYNSVYGTIISVVNIGVSLIIIAWSYAFILWICLRQRQHSDSINKALHTCVTHVICLLAFFMPGVFYIIFLRIGKNYSISNYLQAIFDLMLFVMPSFCNPLIYGLRMMEIRQLHSFNLTTIQSIEKHVSKYRHCG
uniref:G-protein coupled receptors family 1 profile domain-containing protein n=1 Tax=Eptatretus burgeri TaxID=7764 RepID=A0A8C4QDL5_EPTBU